VFGNPTVIAAVFFRRPSHGFGGIRRPRAPHPRHFADGTTAATRSMISMRHTWAAPIGIALISSVGMLSALLGDGLWDALSWLALGLRWLFAFITGSGRCNLAAT
jgi:hypothetical protein